MEVEIVDLSPEPVQQQKPRSPLLPKIFVAFFATLLILNVAIFSFLIGRSTRQGTLPEVDDIRTQFDTPEALGAETEVVRAENEITPTSSLINTSPTPTPVAKQVTINSEPHLDGFRTSSGIGSSLSAIQIGRNSDTVSRGFVSFDLTNIPSNAKIIDAKLQTFIADVQGSPGQMGSLLVDHLIYGDSLNSSDYSAVAMLASFTQTQTEMKKSEWIEFDVTRAVINDRDSARPRSQFRIHYENEVRSESEDFLYIESGENYLETNNLPRLQVQHE